MNDSTEILNDDLSLVDLEQRIEMATTVPSNMTADGVTITTEWEF
jgi:hypothetical protein